jgi:ferric-dicitrate binding protein FerR (iron transport regulator)
VTFERLTIGDAIAWVAALALLLCTAVDWYSTVGGNEARQTQHDVDPTSVQGQLGGEVPRTIEKQAALAAQADEKNIWQETRLYDRLELAVLLAAAAAATVAAVLRTADRHFRGWLTPSAVAAMLAAVGALMVLYRVVQQPGDDQVTVLKSGPWLAFIALGVLGFGASLAARTAPASSDPQPAQQPHAAQTP